MSGIIYVGTIPIPQRRGDNHTLSFLLPQGTVITEMIKGAEPLSKLS